MKKFDERFLSYVAKLKALTTTQKWLVGIIAFVLLPLWSIYVGIFVYYLALRHLKSKKLIWVSRVAVLAYLVLFALPLTIGTIPALLYTAPPKTVKNEESTKVDENKQTDETVAKPAQETMLAEELKLKDSIEKKLIVLFGENAEGGRKRVREVGDYTEEPGDTGAVQIAINIDSATTNQDYRENMWRQASQIYKEIPKLSSKIAVIVVRFYIPVDDGNGKDVDEKLMQIDISKNTWAEINSGNFDYKTIGSIADSYYESPILKQ